LEGPAALAARGKAVYQSNCTACHNADPNVDGPLGPAIKGSSKDLIEARVIHGQYPAGYKPKRMTSLMAVMPYLQADIPALYEYLNAP